MIFGSTYETIWWGGLSQGPLIDLKRYSWGHNSTKSAISTHGWYTWVMIYAIRYFSFLGCTKNLRVFNIIMHVLSDFSWFDLSSYQRPLSGVQAFDAVEFRIRLLLLKPFVLNYCLKEQVVRMHKRLNRDVNLLKHLHLFVAVVLTRDRTWWFYLAFFDTDGDSYFTIE
jgi:hypothetical protein